MQQHHQLVLTQLLDAAHSDSVCDEGLKRLEGYVVSSLVAQGRLSADEAQRCYFEEVVERTVNICVSNSEGTGHHWVQWTEGQEPCLL